MITPLDVLSMFPAAGLTSAQAVELSQAFPSEAQLDFTPAGFLTPLDVLLRFPAANLTSAQAVWVSQTFTPALLGFLSPENVAAIVPR